MNEIMAVTGALVGGPVDGNLVTCEARKIPTVTETRLDIDGSTKLYTVHGSYYYKASDGTFVWTPESVAFPERHMEDIV